MKYQVLNWVGGQFDDKKFVNLTMPHIILYSYITKKTSKS